MTSIQLPIRLWEEIAELLADDPSRDQLLAFRPSEAAQQRASQLLAKLKDESLTFDERRELDQFEHAELLMRLLKARLRAQGPS
ncbi:MAG: hypothetical protein ACREJB_09905 [Planctomycetaceae bacterium]